jgi:hypothetical protein
MPGMFSGDIVMEKMGVIHKSWSATVSGDDVCLDPPRRERYS